MKGFRFLRPAREELLEAAERYESEKAALGASFLTEVQHTMDAARTHPAAGAPFLRDTRRMLVRRFPFSVVYRDEPDRILIVAVAHHRRNQSYWNDRV